jgi:hypothetical protein
VCLLHTWCPHKSSASEQWCVNVDFFPLCKADWKWARLNFSKRSRYILISSSFSVFKEFNSIWWAWRKKNWCEQIDPYNTRNNYTTISLDANRLLNRAFWLLTSLLLSTSSFSFPWSSKHSLFILALSISIFFD